MVPANNNSVRWSPGAVIHYGGSFFAALDGIQNDCICPESRKRALKIDQHQAVESCLGKGSCEFFGFKVVVIVAAITLHPTLRFPPL